MTNYEIESTMMPLYYLIGMCEEADICAIFNAILSEEAGAIKRGQKRVKEMMKEHLRLYSGGEKSK